MSSAGGPPRRCAGARAPANSWPSSFGRREEVRTESGAGNPAETRGTDIGAPGARRRWRAGQRRVDAADTASAMGRVTWARGAVEETRAMVEADSSLAPPRTAACAMQVGCGTAPSVSRALSAEPRQLLAASLSQNSRSRSLVTASRWPLEQMLPAAGRVSFVQVDHSRAPSERNGRRRGPVPVRSVARGLVVHAVYL